MSVSTAPAKSERHRLAARVRWAGHEPRVIVLADLDPPYRVAALALIEADRVAKTKKAAADEQHPATAEPEVSRGRSEPAL